MRGRGASRVEFFWCIAFMRFSHHQNMCETKCIPNLLVQLRLLLPSLPSIPLLRSSTIKRREITRAKIRLSSLLRSSTRTQSLDPLVRIRRTELSIRRLRVTTVVRFPMTSLRDRSFGVNSSDVQSCSLSLACVHHPR